MLDVPSQSPRLNQCCVFATSLGTTNTIVLTAPVPFLGNGETPSHPSSCLVFCKAAQPSCPCQAKDVPLCFITSLPTGPGVDEAGGAPEPG